MISIRLTSVMIDDQARALDFYTNVLGFAVSSRPMSRTAPDCFSSL